LITIESLDNYLVISSIMADHVSAGQRRPSMARRNKHRIGAFSRKLAFSDLDGRTNADKYVNSMRNDLEAQVTYRASCAAVAEKMASDNRAL
jgi:hypothetical protein